MTVEHIEFLVEEPSMEAALRQLLPKLMNGISFDIYPFQCKDELLSRLPRRLKGYEKWLPDSWKVVILVDLDDDDCAQLKARVETAIAESGLRSRTASADGRYSVVSRIAIEELEAWWFGDWAAVCAAYPRAPKSIPAQEKFRDPDSIAGGTWEAFERVLQTAGYFKGGLRKVEAARTIAERMRPQLNTSRSFQAFRTAIEDIVCE